MHARKAYLSGLSPKENRDRPPLKYDYVRKISQRYPNAAFSLNGGIKDVPSTLSLLDEFDGVMLGRAAYANPYLLNELDQVPDPK